jgi:broad specificity phosphatase PhoE
VTTIHLIRHGANDYVETGRLAGRATGVVLNERGTREASRLASEPVLQKVAAIYSSPLERARQTAEPLAEALGLEIQVLEDLNEIDFGEWTGRDYKELENNEEWKRYNLFRSGSPATGGESLIDVQYRMIRAVGQIRHAHPEEDVAVFSHGDPIRSLMCWSLGIPLDLILRIDIGLCSLSTIGFGNWGPIVKSLNICPS